MVLATVYNNLNYLYRNGLVRKISIEGSPDVYDKNVKHDHIICRRCGKLADFSFDDLTESLKKRLDGDLLGYDLKVFFICRDCREKNN